MAELENRSSNTPIRSRRTASPPWSRVATPVGGAEAVKAAFGPRHRPRSKSATEPEGGGWWEGE